MQQTCIQQYVFMSTEIYHVVLYMANSLKKNTQYFLCVPLMIVLCLLEKYTHVKILCYLIPLYHNFMRNTTVQIYINFYFICHVCVLWGHKTVSMSSVRPLNS